MGIQICADCEKVATHEVWHPVNHNFLSYTCKEHARTCELIYGFYVREIRGDIPRSPWKDYPVLQEKHLKD